MLPQAPPQENGKKEKKKTKKKTNSPLHPSRPSPKLPKISVVDKSLNEEELRSQVEEICQYWSVCLKSYQFKMLNFTKCYAVFCL